MFRDHKGKDLKASGFRAALQDQRPGLPFLTRRSSTFLALPLCLSATSTTPLAAPNEMHSALPNIQLFLTAPLGHLKAAHYITGPLVGK